MSIAQVRSYQTSDGTLHSDKGQALDRQYELDVRGIIIDSIPLNLRTKDCYTLNQMAQYFALKAPQLCELTRKYNEAKRRLNNKKI